MEGGKEGEENTPELNHHPFLYNLSLKKKQRATRN
jgi:hypothetical protein